MRILIGRGFDGALTRASATDFTKHLYIYIERTDDGVYVCDGAAGHIFMIAAECVKNEYRNTSYIWGELKMK